MKNFAIFDKIRGALYGVAVGDALGGPLEFMSAEGIEKTHGRVTEMIGGGWLHLTPGEVTDDTQMTLDVARGIVENPEDPVPAIGQNFINWFKTMPKDVGSTCATAIQIAIANKATSTRDWLECAAMTHRNLGGKSAGNGALMRTIYPALYYANPNKMARAVNDIARMTHLSQASADICLDYCDAVRDVIFGKNPLAAIRATYYEPGVAPTGYVVNTWSNAIECIINTETFEDAIVEAVNRGGDADTVAAITGGLAGAYYGFENIPERWVIRLDLKLQQELDKLAEIACKANHDFYEQKFSGKY